MPICKRDSQDPLLRVFLDRYRLNLLALPREGINPGDLFLEKSDRQTIQCMIEDVFSGPVPKLVVSPQQKMADIEETLSGELDTAAGLSLLERFFDSFASGGSAKVRAAYASAGKIRMKVVEPKRQVINVGALSEYLGRAQTREDQTLLRADDKCYVVAGVVRSNAVQIIALDRRGQEIAVDAGATGLAQGNAKLKAERQGTRSLVYKSQNQLVIGVELLQALPSGDTWRLDTVSSPVRVRKYGGAGDPLRSDMRFLGDPSGGDAFVELLPANSVQQSGAANPNDQHNG